MPAPYIAGAPPDEFDNTLETARTLDRHLQQAITDLGQPKGPTMSDSFAASLRAMIDEAKAGVEQAREDGRSKVSAAVAKLNEAKAATVKVSGAIAQTISDQADEVISDLGQISNDL
jgi:hypothetical protein